MTHLGDAMLCRTDPAATSPSAELIAGLFQYMNPVLEAASQVSVSLTNLLDSWSIFHVYTV